MLGTRSSAQTASTAASSQPPVKTDRRSKTSVPPRTTGRSSSPPRLAGSAGGAWWSGHHRSVAGNGRRAVPPASSGEGPGGGRRRARQPGEGRPTGGRHLITTWPLPPALKPGCTARARSTKSSTAHWFQASHRHQNFAGDAQRLTARGDESETRDLAEQGVSQGCGAVDHVLAVVEHDDEGAAGEVAEDEIDRDPADGGRAELGRCPQCAGHARGDPFGFGDAGQLDQPGAVSVLFPQWRPPPPPVGSCPLPRGRSVSRGGRCSPSR